MSKSNLVDRYIYDVGRRLPAKDRKDVQMELRSALQDTLDERGIDPANPAHEEQVVAVLKEFGEPYKVAAGYSQRRFIVGPELQPSYRLVLRIAAFGVTVGQIVRLIVVASQGDAISIGDVVGGFVGGFLTAFAIVSIIFAVLEYFLPDLNLPIEDSFDFARAKNYGQPNQGWDPRTLPELMLDYDKISIFEIAVEIIFTTAFIYFVNAFSGWNLPERITNGHEGAEVVAQLIAVVQPFIPAITGLAVFSIAIRIYLLLRGWDPWTRWAEILYYAGTAVIMALILAAAPYTGIELVDNIARLSVGISLVMCVIYTGAMLYRVLRPNDILPWDGKNLEREIEELGRTGEAVGKAVEARFKKPK